MMGRRCGGYKLCLITVRAIPLTSRLHTKMGRMSPSFHLTFDMFVVGWLISIAT